MVLFQLGILAVALIAGIAIFNKLSKDVSDNPLLAGLFGIANAEEQTSDSQTSDKTAQQSQNSQKISEMDAEILRLNEESLRLESEGAFNRAKEFSAKATALWNEKLVIEAESQKLALEIQAKNSTVDSKIVIGDTSTSDPKKETSVTTQEEIQTSPETSSGQTDTTKAPDTDIKGSDTTVEISVEDDSEDAVIKAISTRRSRPRSSFFSRGSTSQVVVTSDRPDVKITGAGSALEGTQAFIFDTPLRNLSDVLKKFPKMTASQARDFLSRQGTFQNKEAEIAFKAFDFGTNTGNALRPDSEVIKGSVTRTALERQEARAKKKLEAILSSREQSSEVSTIKPVISEPVRRRTGR